MCKIDKIDKKIRKSDYVSDSLARQELEDIPVVVAIKTKKAKREFKFSLISKVAVLFILGLMIIYRFAQITEIGYKTNDIISEYDALVLENNKIAVNIEKEKDLKEIRKRAEELGFRAPAENQIIHIKTPVTDRVDYSDEIGAEEKSVMDNIIEWIKSFFGIG